MELLMALTVGFLVAAGTYLILSRQLFKLALGFALYSHAGNLLLITVGGFKKQMIAPIVKAGLENTARYTDPLPPDIILTAIVISFAISAFFLALIARIHRECKTDDIEELRP
jgi:multicomponent Na+:H+ antiporter subunit C